MPVNEAGSEETPYGRYVTSDGWFVPISRTRSRFVTWPVDPEFLVSSTLDRDR